MVEIKQEDFEWAAIDRMGKMLKQPHQKFQTTQTYSNFAAIMCWTIQRIRTSSINQSTNLATRQVPQNDTNFTIFDSIQLSMLNATIEGYFGSLPNASEQLNSLHLTDNSGHDISALAFAIALRNAVAHGDGRKVKPVNRPGQLVGFEFTLSNPGGFPEWQCQTQLNRSAMAQIAGKLVDAFCSSFRQRHPNTERDLETIGESE